MSGMLEIVRFSDGENRKQFPGRHDPSPPTTSRVWRSLSTLIASKAPFLEFLDPPLISQVFWYVFTIFHLSCMDINYMCQEHCCMDCELTNNYLLLKNY